MKPINIVSVSGKRINLADFKPADVDIESITRGLSNVCRFAGQIEGFYSVAQHSVHVAELLREEALHVRKFGLLHDASEAYIGDVSRQLKHSPYMAGYLILEGEVQNVIEETLMSPIEIALFDEVEWTRLKAADDLMAIFERVVVRDREPWSSKPGVEHVRDAYGDGYVSNVREDFVAQLLPMLDVIAHGFISWSPDHAKHVFASVYREHFDEYPATPFFI